MSVHTHVNVIELGQEPGLLKVWGRGAGIAPGFFVKAERSNNSDLCSRGMFQSANDMSGLSNAAEIHPT